MNFVEKAGSPLLLSLLLLSSAPASANPYSTSEKEALEIKDSFSLVKADSPAEAKSKESQKNSSLKIFPSGKCMRDPYVCLTEGEGKNLPIIVVVTLLLGGIGIKLLLNATQGSLAPSIDRWILKRAAKKSGGAQTPSFPPASPSNQGIQPQASAADSGAQNTDDDGRSEFFKIMENKDAASFGWKRKGGKLIVDPRVDGKTQSMFGEHENVDEHIRGDLPLNNSEDPNSKNS